MPITATSPEAKYVSGLESLLASSSTFQSVVGEASASAAKDHIFFSEANDRLSSEGVLTDARPRAIIEPDNGEYHNPGTACWTAAAVLALTFEFTVPSNFGGTAGRLQRRILWSANKAGAILSEMRVNMFDDQNAYTQFRRFTQEISPFKERHEVPGADFWVTVWLLEAFG